MASHNRPPWSGEGSVTTTPILYPFVTDDGRTPTDYVTIHNKGSGELHLSWDGGVTYTTKIGAGGVFDSISRLVAVYMKSDASCSFQWAATTERRW